MGRATQAQRTFAQIAFIVALASTFGCPPTPVVPTITALTLTMPGQPIYVGSYARIPVQVPESLGVAFDDLTFRVPEGPLGGVVSASKDATFDAKRPEVMLIAGYQPGAYTLEVTRKDTGITVATEKFTTTVIWPKNDPGPSFVQHAMQGEVVAGSAWGGGPSGRQNVGTLAATGTRRIALIFVDTDEQRYPTGAAFDAIRNNWMNNICDGISNTGTTFSLREYYREASQSTFDVSCQPFGPYALAGTWDEIGAGAGWVAHVQAAINVADADIDYRNFDTVLVVSQTVDMTPTSSAKMAWPIASIGEWNGWVTADGSGVSLGSIQMPFDWTVRDGREVYATASHELGHNLGLGDQYTPTVSGRNPGNWELMDGDGALPEMSLAHKLMLGWVNASWVTGFNFATSGSNIDLPVTLRPAAMGAPAAGSFVGAEVRVADGQNYYFEYRRRNLPRVADRSLPTDQRIVLTDVVSGSFMPPIVRPTILLGATIPPSSDGPVLGNGDQYSETDTTSPVFPVEFTASVSNITTTSADLRIRYGINGKPDPSIQPWGAPPWQTTDIEVRNDRNAVDAAWFNVPWQGNPNTVVAKIKNGGNVAAPQVVVNFFVKNYNVGTANESFLGSDVHDIPPGATVEFSSGWTPPTNGHFCIVARIPLYQTPAPTSIVELTEFNNVAQSNYDRFISPSASPAVRQRTTVEVSNPYAQRTRIFLDVRNTNPVYRTYIGHKWLDLNPGEVAEVEVLLEYVGEFPSKGLPGQDNVERFAKLPNHVGLRSFITNPVDPNGHVIEPLGGADLSVVTGRQTQFKGFRVSDRRALGQITTSDGKPVAGGMVILSFINRTTQPERVTTARAELERDARFSGVVPADTDAVRAYYVPPPGLGDATSLTVEN